MTLRAYIGTSLVLWILISWAVHAAFAADLAVPRIHRAPLSFMVAPVVPVPVPRPERCLVTGEDPSPGQTLQVDNTCPTGMRWVYQR